MSENYDVFAFHYNGTRKGTRFPYILAVSKTSNTVLVKTFDIDFIDIDTFPAFSEPQNRYVRKVRDKMDALFVALAGGRFSINGIQFDQHQYTKADPYIKDTYSQKEWRTGEFIELPGGHVGKCIGEYSLPSDLRECQPRELNKFFRDFDISLMLG